MFSHQKPSVRIAALNIKKEGRRRRKKTSDSIVIQGTSSETKDKGICTKFSMILVEGSSAWICTLFASSVHMLPGWIGGSSTRHGVWNEKRHGGTSVCGGRVLGGALNSSLLQNLHFPRSHFQPCLRSTQPYLPLSQAQQTAHRVIP